MSYSQLNDAELVVVFAVPEHIPQEGKVVIGVTTPRPLKDLDPDRINRFLQRYDSEVEVTKKGTLQIFIAGIIKTADELRNFAEVFTRVLLFELHLTAVTNEMSSLEEVHRVFATRPKKL